MLFSYGFIKILINTKRKQMLNEIQLTTVHEFPYNFRGTVVSPRKIKLNVKTQKTVQSLQMSTCISIKL